MTSHVSSGNLFAHNGLGPDYTDSNSASSSESTTFGFNFPYFGLAITQLILSVTGDVYLMYQTVPYTYQYDIGVFHTTSGYTNPYYYRRETRLIYLSDMSQAVRDANPLFTTFTASNAYIVTWFLVPGAANSSLYNSFQLCFATDGTYSFLIYNYERLDQVPGDAYFVAPNNTRVNLAASVDGSNYESPGRFVYRVDGGNSN